MRYEYRFLGKYATEEDLNRLGCAGFRLVSTPTWSNYGACREFKYVFEREAPLC